MSTPSRRNEALLAKSLALAFWLAGWALVAIALASAIVVALLSARAEFVPRYSRWKEVFLDYYSPLQYLVLYLAGACLLLAVSRGVLLAYEALGYLRVLTGEDGYERPVGPTGPPLTISRVLLSIYKALVRFRNFGRFEETEE